MAYFVLRIGFGVLRLGFGVRGDLCICLFVYLGGAWIVILRHSIRSCVAILQYRHPLCTVCCFTSGTQDLQSSGVLVDFSWHDFCIMNPG